MEGLDNAVIMFGLAATQRRLRNLHGVIGVNNRLIEQSAAQLEIERRVVRNLTETVEVLRQRNKHQQVINDMMRGMVAVREEFERKRNDDVIIGLLKQKIEVLEQLVEVYKTSAEQRKEADPTDNIKNRLRKRPAPVENPGLSKKPKRSR